MNSVSTVNRVNSCNYVVEEAYQSIARHGEELCGDHVEIIRKEDGAIFVLSDGLGSGVKANILATLTSKIAIGLIEKNIPLEEIIETIIATLPICEVRGMAYSTLAVLQVFNNGQAHLIELDSPPAFILSENKVVPIKTNERTILGKLVKEARFDLQKGDCVFIASDGILHAGIGGLTDFGLGWEGVAEHLEEICKHDLSLNQIVDKIMRICQAYYLLEPGDDFTLVGVSLREPRNLTIMTGPPIKEVDDLSIVARLNKARGAKIICGGTTAQIYAREMNKEIVCGFDYVDPDIPPVSQIEGIELVTEGLLTLNKTLEYLHHYQYPDLPQSKDGASLLAKRLLESDQVVFLVGRAINEAHQSLNLPVNLGIRTQVIERLANSLKNMHKDVEIQWF